MSGIKWGMPTLVGYADMETNARLCRKLGLDFVELNMNLPMFQPESLEAAWETAKHYGIGLTLHLDENFAPADFNPRIADAHMETLRQTIRAAVRIGAPVINMHLNRGVYFSLPEEKVFLFERYSEFFLERMRLLKAVCEAEVGAGNLRICIENTNGYLDFQKEAVGLLLESDVFALTWDVGHSHGVDMDDEGFMLSRRNRLAHFHIHDAKGKKNHLPLGTGELPVDERLRLAESLNASCVVEVKTPAVLEESVCWLRQRDWMKEN